MYAKEHSGLLIMSNALICHDTIRSEEIKQLASDRSMCGITNAQHELEQLERLPSDVTPAASWLTILLSHIGSQVKRRQSYKFKEFAKISKQTSHATHHLKLLDKTCKYEMDPTSIVEGTERTRFCPQMDRRARWNQYTPLSTSLKRGYNEKEKHVSLFY